jgi:hypothetical protein
LAQRIIWRSGASIGIPTAKEQAMPELAVSREKIGSLIEKAQEFDVKDLPADEESGSNPTDDAEVNVLQDDGCDSVAAELASLIRASNEDEQIDLVALMWLGRGDGTIDEWEDLRTRAAERRNGYRPCVICSASRCWAISWPKVSTGSEYPGSMRRPGPDKQKSIIRHRIGAMAL